jgi:hypothetical protein
MDLFNTCTLHMDVSNNFIILHAMLSISLTIDMACEEKAHYLAWHTVLCQLSGQSDQQWSAPLHGAQGR